MNAAWTGSTDARMNSVIATQDTVPTVDAQAIMGCSKADDSPIQKNENKWFVPVPNPYGTAS